MKSRGMLVAGAALIIAAIVGVWSAPAAAKGADQATITGPGLAKAIVVGGDGEPGSGEALGTLADGTGLFVAMFGADSGQRLAATAPTSDLGPKYQVVYRIPGGNPTPDSIRQDLYPMADGGPVSHIAAGQAVFGNQTTGGWYRGTATLTQTLRMIGVPTHVASGATAPATAGVAAATGDAAVDTAGGTPWGLIGGLAAVVAAVLAVLVIGLRRRAA